VPDPVALIGGLLAIAVAASAATGIDPGSGVDLRWALALVAVGAGAIFLLAGLRNSRGRSDD
jgi:hypothetical protein